MAAPGPWVIYNDFKLNIGKKLIDLINDTFKVALVTSLSNAIDATLTPATYTTLNHEVASGNGYTTAGASAATPAWTGGGATASSTFDTADVTWTASGAGITARAAVLYDVTSGHLVAYMLLDSAPADVVIQPAVTEVIQIANVFTLT